MDLTELMVLLHDQAPDAVIFADQLGIIRAWNESAVRIFGFGRAEALGQSLDLIIPEQFREAHWKGYEQALASGETKYRGKPLPTRSVRKDASTLYVELTFAIVRDATGQIIGALAHARDITERWTKEREQRGKLRELEQKLDRAGE